MIAFNTPRRRHKHTSRVGATSTRECGLEACRALGTRQRPPRASRGSGPLVTGPSIQTGPVWVAAALPSDQGDLAYACTRMHHACTRIHERSTTLQRERERERERERSTHTHTHPRTQTACRLVVKNQTHTRTHMHAHRPAARSCRPLRMSPSPARWRTRCWDRYYAWAT